jgi:hypothetical protein
VPVRNIGTMLGRPAREQQLFTQSVPILAGHTEQTPKPLPLVTATVYAKASAISHFTAIVRNQFRKCWRPRPELNRGKRFCRPLRNHSATWP